MRNDDGLRRELTLPSPLPKKKKRRFFSLPFFLLSRPRPPKKKSPQPINRHRCHLLCSCCCRSRLRTRRCCPDPPLPRRTRLRPPQARGGTLRAHPRGDQDPARPRMRRALGRRRAAPHGHGRDPGRAGEAGHRAAVPGQRPEVEGADERRVCEGGGELLLLLLVFFFFFSF